MIYRLTAITLTALSLIGCASTGHAPDIGLCDNAKSSVEECRSLYTSEYNRFVAEDFTDDHIAFNGYIISFDKSEFADYSKRGEQANQFADWTIRGSNGAVIDFSAEQTKSDDINERLNERIYKTFSTQGKGMFAADVTASRHVTDVDYNITTTCRDEDLRDAQTYVDCTFKGFDQLESAIATELTSKANTDKPYSHIVLLSTGWHNRQFNSLKHFNLFFQNLNASGGESFNPLYIGVTWPSDWNVKYVSYLNKSADADEVGLIWGNYLINKTIPMAIERAQTHHKPKFVAIGHSFGARVVATGLNSKDYITSYKPAAPLDVLILKQPAFSRSRLAKHKEMARHSHFNYYSNLDANAKQIIVTASRRDNYFGNGIAFWSGGGTGHAGTARSYKQSCDFVKKHPQTWGQRYACYQQTDVINGEWASLLDDNKPILYLRLDSKVKGKEYNSRRDIISGHNGVKDKPLTDAFYDLIK